MSNIISADNGAFTGIAGIKLSSDTSGALVIQSGNNVTALTVDSSQNLSLVGNLTVRGMDPLGTANLAYTAANSGIGIATSAFGQANSAFGQANLAYTTANSGVGIATSAFGQANLAYTAANSGVGIATSAFGQANLAYTAANTAVTTGQANTGAGLIATTSAYQANSGAGLISLNSTLTSAYQANVGSAIAQGQANTGAGLITEVAARQANTGAGLISLNSTLTSAYQANVGAGLITLNTSLTSAYQANVGAGLITEVAARQANTGAGLISLSSTLTSAYQANSGAGLISLSSTLTSAYQANVGAGLLTKAGTTGSGASGTWGINVTGSAGSATTATNVSGGTVSATTGTFSGLIKADGGTTQVGSSAGTYRQFRYDGTISSDGTNFYTLLNSNNYTSYSPSLTGSGASGTWSITATNATNSTLLSNAGTGIYAASSGTAYSSVVCVREAGLGGSGASAPRLGWHWGGVVASSISIESGGRIAVCNNPGTSYENFIAAISYGSASVRAPLFYDSDNTGYYVDAASTSQLNQVNLNGPLVRTTVSQGYLSGNYASSETSYTPGCIYTIGGSYVPSGSSLNNIYGIGYTHTNQGSMLGSGGWGLWVSFSGTVRHYLDEGGNSLHTGNVTAYYSDERLKTKLGKIENPIEKVKSLNGFYYEANEIAQQLGYKVKREVGLSAQEVQAILPEIVAPAPVDAKYLTIHYERIVPLLVEAIKEQQLQIEELKSLVLSRQ